MDTLMKADIFFFVTTISVILLTLLAIVAFIYIVKILHNIRAISETIKNESNLIAEDMDDIRARVRSSGFTFLGVFRLFRDIFASRSRRK